MDSKTTVFDQTEDSHLTCFQGFEPVLWSGNEAGLTSAAITR
ncbi:hypothetical protein [Actinocrispum sp. NPDC049592]